MAILEYYGHSCFRLTSENGYRIVFDPYEKGSVPGLELPDDIDAEQVICSHDHADHNAAKRIHIVQGGPVCPYEINQLVVPHDHHDGTKRGMNRITILTGGGTKIAHFGDLGRPLTDTEADALKGADLIMIPCGGYFTIDAHEAYEIIRRMKPHTAVLMHYRSALGGYDVTSSLEEVHQVIRELVILKEHSIDLSSSVGIIALAPLQK